MHQKGPYLFIWLSLFILGIFVPSTSAQGLRPIRQAPPPADIENDEGGPVRVIGRGDYTNFEVAPQLTEPAIVLLDQGGQYAARDNSYAAPAAGQIFGRLTSPFDTPPFTYQIDLPQEPLGEAYDVDNDAEVDLGVQIWVVSVRHNPNSEPRDPYLLPLEQAGQTWLNSVLTRKATAPELLPEPYAGTLLVYVPEEGQGFPAGFGEDGFVFTKDDPIVRLPQGYTLVTLNETGFTFDRSHEVRMDIEESPTDVQVDFSDLDYVAAFSAFIDLMVQRYAYTELRNINWESWRAEYSLRIEQAAEDGDAEAFSDVFEEIADRSRDRHFSVPVPVLTVESITTEVQTGVGLDSTAEVRGTRLVNRPGLVELADGRVLVTNVREDSPAAAAGIEPLAELSMVDGTPVANLLDRLAEGSSFATPESRRLDALSRLTSGSPETDVELTYQNPGGETRTVTLSRPPFSFDTFNAALSDLFGQLGNLPDLTTGNLQTRNGQPIGYVAWGDFFRGNIKLPTLSNYLQSLSETPALIIDLRNNGGGSEWLMMQMAAYFFAEDDPLLLDRLATSRYDAVADGFVTTSAFGIPARLPIHAPLPQAYYPGEVVILVGDNCASSCEFFSAWLQRSGRATVIGAHGTRGAGGAVQQVLLPEGVVVNYTYSRETDLQGEPYIEAKGIEPDLRLPLDDAYAEALVNSQDPVLDYALAWLDESLPASRIKDGQTAAHTADTTLCAPVELATGVDPLAPRNDYRSFGDEVENRADISAETLSVPEEATDVDWTNAVLGLLGYCGDDSTTQTITLYRPNPDTVTAVVLTQILFDDSVAAEEVRLDLKKEGDRAWSVEWAGIRWQCARGPDTDSFTTNLCP
jgi:C-terminal processing protease CtpA/Prc